MLCANVCHVRTVLYALLNILREEPDYKLEHPSSQILSFGSSKSNLTHILFCCSILEAGR